VSVYRWVQTFTPEFIDAARPSRHSVGDRWFVDETYVKVAGRWTYLYRAVDQHGQVIDVLVSKRRDRAAARAFFTRAKRLGPAPVEVATDRAPIYQRAIDDLLRGAWHVLEQYANNAVEADHGRLKARLRPMRGLKSITSLSIAAAGHAHSCRTCAAATTNSPPTCPSTIESGERSPSSQTASDPRVSRHPRQPAAVRSINATVPIYWVAAAASMVKGHRRPACRSMLSDS
jgi:transposase, IS6 family